jgi:PAS domain-containing protein
MPLPAFLLKMLHTTAQYSPLEEIVYHQVTVVTANPELSSSVSMLIEQYQLPVSLLFAEMDNEIKTVHEAAHNGAEVIIGRGQLVSTFPTSLDLPIVKIDISKFDLLCTLREVNVENEHVAIIGFKDVLANCNELDKFLNFPLLYKEVNSVKDILNILSNLEIHNIKYVVGTYGIVNKARLFGLYGYTIKSSSESILKAIKEALHIAHLRSIWRERSEMLHAVMNTIGDGIIAIDRDERITFFNPAAESVFNLDNKLVLGEKNRRGIPGVTYAKNFI